MIERWPLGRSVHVYMHSSNCHQVADALPKSSDAMRYANISGTCIRMIRSMVGQRTGIPTLEDTGTVCVLLLLGECVLCALVYFMHSDLYLI